MQVRAKGLACGNALGWDRAWNVPGMASTPGSQAKYRNEYEDGEVILFYYLLIYLF